MTSPLNRSSFVAAPFTTFSRSRALRAAVVLTVAASSADAQWGVIHLGPGQALGVGGHRQVGTSGGGAAMWSDSAETVQTLAPAFSIALGTDGTQQVGGVSGHAALWSGSAGSYVDLNPDFYPASAATCVDAGVQAGSASHSLATYACIWTGSPASVVFLGQGTSAHTEALAIHAGHVAGVANFGTSPHARLWTAPGSFVDLNPVGHIESKALGIHASTEVGWTRTVVGQPEHAALWNDTAASWVDLHPAGADQSQALAVDGSYQVGEVTIAGRTHASLWSGTAASWVDLDAFLPDAPSSSVATGVWTDVDGTTYISGYSSAGALLWVSSVHGTAFCFGDGSGSACPCGNNAVSGSATGCLNSLGSGGKLVAAGTPSISNDTLALLGTNVANGSALYFQGTAQINAGQGSVFGDGLRCVGGSVVRLGTKTSVGGASHYPVLGDPKISVVGADAAGDVRHYQCWYRNAASFCTASAFNLTNGVSVMWTP